MRKNIFIMLLIVFSMFFIGGCNDIALRDDTPKSSSGVSKASVQVETDLNGFTVEQKNVAKRLANDNKVGSTKHLYVISTYSGQVIIYSTVVGKVTSSGKRLTPNTLNGYVEGWGANGVDRVNISGEEKITNEVLQDDGTYGSSEPYIFWWDTRDVYHQHYVSGGQIIHISDQPLVVKNVIINMELK